MTPLETDSWRRIVKLFEQVGDLPEDEREAFLASCGESPEIVAEARQLLASDAAATEGFLAPPAQLAPPGEEPTEDAPARDDPSDDPSDDPWVGPSATRLERLGPYRLVRELGRGGMGTVYLGERDDGQFEDRVAVKLLHGIQTQAQRRRFLVERQILASLRHPHIAYLLDGGLGDDDRPYLVMELVDGEPLDAFCAARDLPVAERLRLFLQVAAAVEHAHRNLVVHRDLKPSNVMVVADDAAAHEDGTARGTVKLLDFGIAKILDDGAPGLTRTGHRMMTPSYASPEQVLGEAVTTASDVYQLGFLLYELLTGRRPYRTTRSSSPFALALAILEGDPEAPSRAASRSAKERSDAAARSDGDGGATSGDGFRHDEETKDPAPDFLSLPRSQRADIDAILLTALSKDPSRRYPSVRDLADDVERFLDGRPVEARGDGRLYRLGKWVRRHKAATVAAAASLLLVVSVAVLGALALVQAEQLEAERDRAEAEATKANLVADYLADVFAGADPERHDGAEPTARDLLELGASRIDELEVPEARLQLTAILARAFSSLGEQERARELALRRLDLAREAGEPASQAAALEELATIDRLSGELETSLRWLEEAEPLRRAAVASPEATWIDRSKRAGHLRLLGETQRDLGRWPEAAETLARSAELYGQLRRDATSENELRWGREGQAWALTSLTGVQQYLRRLDEAEANQRLALEIYEELGEADALTGLNALHNLAMILWQRDRAEEAVPMNETVLEGYRRIYGGDHLNVAVVLGNHALVLRQLGRIDNARAHVRQALEMQRRILPPGHPSLGSSLHNLGALALLAGELAEAESYLRQALALRREALGDEHPSVASSASSLADALETQGRAADALPLRREALSIVEASLPADHPDVAEARQALETTRSSVETPAARDADG